MAKLQYWRADNMWAAEGRPDGNLGMEEVSVEPGKTRAFVTDWRYEKQRNDGTNYYGSHARRLTNAGPTDIVVKLTAYPSMSLLQQIKAMMVQAGMRMPAGKSIDCKADIIEVSCPAKS